MKKKILLISLILALFMLIPASKAVAAPILISPSDGSIVSNPVSFSWTVGGGSPYTLEITDLSTGSVTTLTLTRTSYSLTLTPGPYSWRVQDSTSWSVSWSFYVQGASIWISPQQGYAGTSITVSGSGWAPRETIRVYYDQVLRHTLSPATSSWVISITATGGLGYHTITATGTISGSQFASFRVIGPPPNIVLSKSQGSPGEHITVRGTNFHPYETVRVTFGGLGLPPSPTTADANGSWSISITIPEKPAGLYIIDAYGSTTLASSVPDESFEIVPKLVASSNFARMNEQVTISGKGFHASSSISLSCDGAIFSALSNSLGSFSTLVTVPSKGQRCNIIARDSLGASALISIEILSPISVMLNLTTGAVGEELIIGGNSQVPGTVTIAYDGATIGRVTPDANGDFVFRFKIPKSNLKQHTITVTDSNGNTALATFALESIPPPTPRPLEPDYFSRVGGRTVRFEWTEVSDPSGVSYNLLVYDANMREVLNIREIERTSFQARLPGRGTFSWAIQAQDGAGNMSPYSEMVSFTVSQGLNLWVMVIMILIALCLVIGGIYYYFFKFFRQPRKAPASPAYLDAAIRSATEKAVKKLTPEISAIVKKEIERQLARKEKPRRRK